MRRLLLGSALVAPLVATLLGGCRRSASPDESTIRAARVAQNRAIAAGALDSAATFWVSDVAVTAGLGATLQGREIYKQAFAHDADFRYERSTARVVVSSNWPLAWEQGTWAGFRNGVVAPVIQGSYSAMWIKDGGRWRIRSELFVAMNCAAAACRWPVGAGSK
jgi:ketosteroid isomerase-like protein